jgi:putative FmdB family regulatory protein
MGKSALRNDTGMEIPLWKGSSMPIYEFKCDKCEAVQDIALDFVAPKVVICENCQVPMWRIWTPTPTHFKGDGWASKS